MTAENFLNLIIARLDGESIDYSDYRQYIEKLTRDGIGGFIVFGGDYDKIKNFIVYLQSVAHRPLIIASDIERGVGQQIKRASLIPSQMGITAGFNLPDEEHELKTLYSIVIKEAADIGINLALIPVLDVNTAPQNPIICTRAFSDNPDTVSEYGNCIINFFEANGLLTCAKHFPGHGGTQIDSHIELPTINESLDIHLKPFKKAINASVSSMMIGHLMIPEIDSLPATLSEKAINQLLKQTLDFKGAVLTDAMNMKALKNYNNHHARAIKSGADIVLHPENQYKAMEEIKSAYNYGLITENRITEALFVINRLKKKIRSFPVTNNYINTRANNVDSSLIIQRAFKKTVTVIKNEIPDLESRKIIPCLTGSYSEEIKEAFKNYFGSVYDLTHFSKTSLSGVIPLIAVFTNIKAAGDEHVVSEEQNIMIKDIFSSNDTVFVSFGNPYIMRFSFFKRAKTIILVYDSNINAVSAFIDVFKDGLKTSGRLPVKIEWIND